MKTYRFFFLLSICAAAGCQPDLDLAPLTTKSSSTFYQTEADAKGALTAAYSSLQTGLYAAETIVTPTTVAADDGVPFLTGNADRRGLWSYNFTSANTWTSLPWSVSYSGIQRANAVINRVPGITMNDELKKRYVAEARFLRALHYFNLVRFYGGVPLVSEEASTLDNIQVPRAAAEEVYAFIETDLKAAEAVLPLTYPAAEVGRATRGAAKGLLAKLYLTWAGKTAASPYWSRAAAKAKEVMDMGMYDLWANYADVFDMKNRGGKESVFEVTYVTDVIGQQHSTYWAPRGAPIVPSNGFGTIRVSQSLWDGYLPTDKRREATFLTSFVNPASGQVVQLSVADPDPARAVAFWKLTDLTSKVFGGNGKSFPYMRFSDILLIYAEALSEAENGPGAEAYAAINRVRARAGLDPLEGLSGAQFKDAVLQERRLELCHEGHRWFDLSRTGRLLDAVKAEVSFGRNPVIQPHHVRFPIPQREVGANPALQQNEGY